MAHAANGASACALTLSLVKREVRRLERELEVDYCGLAAYGRSYLAVTIRTDHVRRDRLARLCCALDLLEAALAWHTRES